MNLDYIKRAIEQIERMAGDDEIAHSKEDALHIEFITFIAENNYGDLTDMAKEILKVGDIDFSRWCA